jgi:protein-disulfide isomerase
MPAGDANLDRWLHRIGGPTVCVVLIAALSAAGQGGSRLPQDLRWAGDPDAPLRIEVYSDFQCPVCRTFYLGTMKPLISDLTRENKIDRVCIVHHDFPLEMHKFARKAACYALAASKLGREPWLRVSEALYQEQAQWSTDGNIEGTIAKVLDPLELTRIRALASDPAIDTAVGTEIAFGRRREVRSTPTFFIVTETGRQERVSGTVPYQVLKNRLDQLMK